MGLEDCPEENKKFFDDWADLNLICPDVTEMPFDIRGDPSKMVQHTAMLQIRKCLKDPMDNDLRNCPEDTDEWLRDVSIEQWVIHPQIFFEKRQEMPVYYTMSLKS